MDQITQKVKIIMSYLKNLTGKTDKPFSVLNIMLMEKSIALNVLSTDKHLI